MDFKTEWMNRRVRENARVMIDVTAKVMMNAFEGDDEGKGECESGVFYT